MEVLHESKKAVFGFFEGTVWVKMGVGVQHLAQQNGIPAWRVELALDLPILVTKENAGKAFAFRKPEVIIDFILSAICEIVIVSVLIPLFGGL